MLQLPGPEKPSVVVKCCPVPFALRQPDSSLTEYVGCPPLVALLLSSGGASCPGYYVVSSLTGVWNENRKIYEHCVILCALNIHYVSIMSLFHFFTCSLPYRMVYAVASLDSILFYDTQHCAPFAHVSNIHYSGITDMAWYMKFRWLLTRGL